MGSTGAIRGTPGGRALRDRAPFDTLSMPDSINIFNVMMDKSGAFPPFFGQDSVMELKPADLPDDIDALKARVLAAESRTASDALLIAHLQLLIEKMRREKFGPRRENLSRILDQLEFQLEEACAAATEDELAALQAAAKSTTTIPAHERKHPVKKPLPAHLPRERVVVPGPASCSCCGGAHLAKLGEDVTETLEVIPRQWKVIQTVREKFTCRDCEAISQPPAPFHAIPRGSAGPNLLAMVLFEKFGQHQPLNRQAERYAREGVEIPLSTLADHVGSASFALMPLFKLIETQGGLRHRAMLGLCPRRSALWRDGAAGGLVLLLTRSGRGASANPSGDLHRHSAGRRL